MGRHRSRSREKHHRRERKEDQDARGHDDGHDHKSKGLVAEKLAKEQLTRLQKIEEERTRIKEEAKKQKEQMKSMESAEQKRLRRLAKKEAKERKRKQMMGWDEEYMGYTNADNPFGDANLLRTFVWTKKYEDLGIKDIDAAEIERENKIKLEENKRELEKVKRRRLEREKEREERMDEQGKMQREKEAAQFKEWEKQEDCFHLKQAKLRSKLRIKEGRAKPIDLLARYIDAFTEKSKEEKEEMEDKFQKVTYEDDLSVELVEPYYCLNGLRTSDLEDLQEDIKVYMQLDSQVNLDYWKDLQVIVEDELYKLKKYQVSGSSAMERREGINSAVSTDVMSIFKGKTPAQLSALQIQIEDKINSGEEGIDISYWETLLSRLKAHMARARLRERHEDNLKKRLLKFKEEQGVNNKSKTDKKTSTCLFPSVKSEISSSTLDAEIEAQEEQPIAGPSTDIETDIPQKDEVDIIEKNKQNYESGRYSPMLIPFTKLEAGTLFVDPEEDVKKLSFHRQKMLSASSEEDRKKAMMTSDELAFEREARKGMTDDEAMFSVEETIKQDRSVTSWSDKYRPRKPRYFNRVHTGFEWNKYNQTHYDVDNPPPKIVQGYKFNIFYPDLIEKSKTPTFKVIPCEDNREFAIIRFTSGPPYEDIAFKIVNREWNYSYKSGFRCQFHNNILQLWFHFKRYRYRR